jgi:ferredoxin
MAEQEGLRMDVRVDSSKCQGHGRCNTLCPEVFVLDEEGFATVDSSAVAQADPARIHSAAANCPENAITVS